MALKLKDGFFNFERVVQLGVDVAQVVVDTTTRLEPSKPFIQQGGRLTPLFEPFESLPGAAFMFGEEFGHGVLGKSELSQRCQTSINFLVVRCRLVHDRSIPYGPWGAFNMSGSKRLLKAVFGGHDNIRHRPGRW